MNTKTEQISSGLVAVRIDTDGYPLVRLSDAEAIISAKDVEILEQCRINGMGAEREASLLGKVERQYTALKLARATIELLRKAMSSDSGLQQLSAYNRGSEALAAINEVIGE